MKTAFYIAVGGADVTGNFSADATDITVTDSSGETADTASISLADDDGHIALPGIGDPIEIGLGSGQPVLVFEGFVDDVSSAGSRGGGRTLSISAKSADTVKAKVKEAEEKHEDDTTFGEVAKKWGQAAGLGEVIVHGDLAGIHRKYWSMNNESFAAWGERQARAIGATFKIVGSRGIFVPRSAGVSATGRALVPIVAKRGDNLLSWNIKPLLGRPQHAEFRSRFFDVAAGEWKDERKGASYDTSAEAVGSFRYAEPDADQAGERAGSDEKESDRERGGGSVEILGNPMAQAEAPCQIVGARPGVDGSYTIESVTHRHSRGGGFVSSLSLKRPGEGAGSDTR